MDINAKRKRGRPAAPQSEPQEERVPKRKRVEPPNPVDSEVAEGSTQPKDAQPKQKKRGRPSNASIAEQNQAEELSAPRAIQKEQASKPGKQKQASGSQQNREGTRGSRGQKPVDYGQRRKYSTGNQNGENSQSAQQAKNKDRVENIRSAPPDVGETRHGDASNDAGKKSRGGRPPKSSQAKATEQEEERPESTSNQVSKRKQNSKSKAVAQEEPIQQPKKRRRPSLTAEDQVANAREQPAANEQSKKRGRPSNSNINPPSDSQNQSSTNVPKQKRGRPSLTNTEAPNPTSQPTKKTKSRDEPTAEASPKRKKQRPNPSEKAPEIAHQRLVPREHKISRDTISTKWTPLLPPSINRISTLLHEAERPILHYFPTQSHLTVAQAAISSIIQRVERRLRKGFPFPASTEEEDFDLEGILRGNKILGDRLGILIHSNELLESDRKKEEELLEREKRILRKVEEGVREEERFNKGELRKLEHGLLKDLKIEEDADLRLGERKGVGLSELQKDEDMMPLIKQLQGHLESLQGNMDQVRGIGEALVENRAVVEDVLSKRVGGAVYDGVVFG